MIEERDLEEFHRLLVAQVESVSDEPADTQFEWDVRLAEVMLGYMEESGYADEPNLCPHEDATGRNLSRIAGYAFRDDKQTLELYTSAFLSGTAVSPLPPAEIRKLTGRAARFFDHITKGNLDRFEANSMVHAAATMIQDNLDKINLVRVHLLTKRFCEGRPS